MSNHGEKDNLEEFFRRNLEDYAPVPSADFWSKVEPVLPPKPSVLGRRLRAGGKWAGLGLLTAAVTVAALFWWNDRRELARLGQTVAEQQWQIEQLNRSSQMPSATPPGADRLAAQSEVETAGATQIGGLASNDGQLHHGFYQPKTNTHGTGRQNGEAQAALSDVPFFTASSLNGIFSKSPDNQYFNKEAQLQQNALAAAGLVQEEPAPAAVESNASQSEAHSPASFIGLRQVLVASTDQASQASPEVFALLPRPPGGYPRFSFEGGGTLFFMPVGRLFQDSSASISPGKTRSSSAGQFWVNFEMNPTYSLQTGFCYLQVRSDSLSLRYNRFPVGLIRQWGFGARNRLEVKATLSLHSLVGAVAADSRKVAGLKSTWLGLETAATVAMPLGQSVVVLAGPSLGYSLTPVANGKRAWSAGFGVGVRYLVR